MSNQNNKKFALENLLDLDGMIIEQQAGCWVKFEVKRINPNENFPHGVRYSLTLHNRFGERIIGFDNAHPVKERNKKKRRMYDHYHRYGRDRGVPYEFICADKLLTDFWIEVDKILSMLKEEEIL